MTETNIGGDENVIYSCVWCWICVFDVYIRMKQDKSLIVLRAEDGKEKKKKKL